MMSLTRNQVVDIIEKIKDFAVLKSDYELSKVLGVTASAISSWKQRGSVDFILIKSKFPNISIDWLLGDKVKPNIEYKDSISLGNYMSLGKEVAKKHGLKIIFKMQCNEV